MDCMGLDVVARMIKYNEFQEARREMRYQEHVVKVCLKHLNEHIMERDCTEVMRELSAADTRLAALKTVTA